MLDLAVSLWLGTLIATSALLGLVLAVQAVVRRWRRRPVLSAEDAGSGSRVDQRAA